MEINVFSLEAAKKVINPDSWWISIRHTEKECQYFYENIIADNMLKLYFDDITRYAYSKDIIHPYYKETLSKRKPIFFEEGMAWEVRSFVDTAINKNIREMNIHCWAGISRSQAIGHMLNIYVNLIKFDNKIDFFRNLETNNKKFEPNPEVLKIMGDVLFGV